MTPNALIFGPDLLMSDANLSAINHLKIGMAWCTGATRIQHNPSSSLNRSIWRTFKQCFKKVQLESQSQQFQILEIVSRVRASIFQSKKQFPELELTDLNFCNSQQKSQESGVRVSKIPVIFCLLYIVHYSDQHETPIQILNTVRMKHIVWGLFYMIGYYLNGCRRWIVFRRPALNGKTIGRQCHKRSQ